jgi:hypothetical protein
MNCMGKVIASIVINWSIFIVYNLNKGIVLLFSK